MDPLSNKINTQVTHTVKSNENQKITSEKSEKNPPEKSLKDSVKEITQDKGLNELKEKIQGVKPSKIDPNDFNFSKFESKDLSKAKALISDILADPKAGFPARMQFDKLVDSMSKDDLVALAKHINGLMANTDGQDKSLGELQERVLGELEQNDLQRIFEQEPPHQILDPQPQPFKPPYGPLAKYTCVYANRSKAI